MATRVKVECINKRDRSNHYERIKAIGGRNGDGSRWKLSEEDAIAGIRAGKWQFYVERPTGHVVNVIIARSQFGHDYLKTEADGERPDNLLALPECPPGSGA
jgi:hypothetical protein